MSCDLKNESCGFKCTGYIGSAIWKEIHSLPSKIECSECAAHAEELFTGVHDAVNIGLGKKIQNPKNFEKFAREIACTYSKCKERGECS